MKYIDNFWLNVRQNVPGNEHADRRVLESF